MPGNKAIQLSPNSLNLFLECPACFWLEKKEGMKRPEPYPYSLNSSLDFVLKKEFDHYRDSDKKHPLLVSKKIPAKLFKNKRLLNQWRNSQEGIHWYDEEMDAVLFGAVDDILEFDDGRLAPLDYKSTGSKVSAIYDRFQFQMDTYDFLLEKNGFKTIHKGYLAFYLVDPSLKKKTPFSKELYEIDCDPSDVKDIFEDGVKLLRNSKMPSHSRDCQYGKWFKTAAGFLKP